MTRHLSLRNRVLLVGLIAVGVSIALSQYQVRAERTRRLAVAGRNAMVTSSTASAAVGFVVQDLYGFIRGTEEAPAVRAAGATPEACTAFLRTALDRGSARVMVSNIFVADATGRLLCQAREGTINARDDQGRLFPWMLAQFERDYLLTTSTPFYGPISKSWVVILSMARSAPDGGVVATAVNLEQFNQILEPIGGANALVTVADAEGNTMLRSADFQRRISQKVPFRSSVPGLSQRMWGDPVARDTAGRIMAAQQEPVISTDSSGIERVWATSLVAGVPWVVYSGVSAETTHVPVWLDNSVLMATGTVVAILALLATVSRDISRLVSGVARSSTEGPLAIPVEGSKEVVDLGLALRRALERRVEVEAELAAANRDLERRVQERSAELQAKAYDLEAANAQLVAAARIKDDFLAVMSHELRTPLSSVLGLTEALREGVYGPVTPRQDQALGQSEEAGTHLLGLVNDVLDFSKIQSGGFSLELDDVELCEVLTGSIALVQPLADARQLRISMPAQHQGLLLRGDVRRLRQVFVNLLGNAIKFTPEGGTIHISCDLGDTPASVTLGVRDTGIGIAPQDLARIFEPFTQVHQGLDRRFSGTGLGLALSQAIVRAHGGALTAESRVGEGSTFSVRLPVAPRQETSASAEPA